MHGRICWTGNKIWVCISEYMFFLLIFFFMTNTLLALLINFKLRIYFCSSGVFSSLRELYRENGVYGFFSGLVPRLLAEVCQLAIWHSLTYALTTYVSRDKEHREFFSTLMGVSFNFNTVMYKIILLRYENNHHKSIAVCCIYMYLSIPSRVQLYVYIRIRVCFWHFWNVEVTCWWQLSYPYFIPQISCSSSTSHESLFIMDRLLAESICWKPVVEGLQYFAVAVWHSLIKIGSYSFFLCKNWFFV